VRLFCFNNPLRIFPGLLLTNPNSSVTIVTSNQPFLSVIQTSGFTPKQVNPMKKNAINLDFKRIFTTINTDRHG